MFRDLLNETRKIKETAAEDVGQPYKLIKSLDSEEARRLHVRVDDPANYPVGTTLYFKSEIYDEDGFWWVTFVKDKALLDADSYGSRDPGVVTFTPMRYKDVFRVLTPTTDNEEQGEVQ